MSLLDPAFLFSFLPLSLLLFYVAGRWGGPTLASQVFALASIVFCVPFGWRFTLLTLASAAINGCICMALAAEAGNADRRRLLFRSGVTINLLVLALFKYVPSLTAIPAAQALAPSLLLWVPITISFFTFQRLVLLADCYRRDPASLDLVQGRGGTSRFLAFTMSFPNLVIGPIAFASEVGPQIRALRFGRLRVSDLEVGLTLMAIGLFKKLVIADSLGTDIVDPSFMRLANGNSPAGPDACLTILAYYAQLYFDFSGYSDIALGIARLFGLRLPFNFNSPLRSTGIVDFYRRWHITLTRIVSRFLFQALSLKGTRFTKRRKWKKGPRRKALELWLPLIVNFLVIGIWHGATWTFVVFGIVHGAWYIIETELHANKWFAARCADLPEWLRIKIGQAITIIPLAVTFSLFRSASLSQFGALLTATVTNWSSFLALSTQHIVQGKQLAELVIAFAIIWLLPNSQELLARYCPGIVTFVMPSHTPSWLALRWRPTLVWGLFTAVLLSWVIMSRSAPAPFVYGGF